MKTSNGMRLSVGLFLIAVVLALVVLAFRVSGSMHLSRRDYYEVTAEFDNIGSLRHYSAVALSGVRIGYVDKIELDPKTFRAVVTLLIKRSLQLPVDSSASIFTQGLLGAKYIAIAPGFDEKNLQPGANIETTHSALVLENLIGQFIYRSKSSGSQTIKKQGDKK